MLYDNHQRPLTYLRLAVTDRCNLRCFYCMPEAGVVYQPKHQLLTYEEMVRLITLLADMGIYKVRITGGEPFVRHDLMLLLRRIAHVPGIRQLHLTTNGLLAGPHVPELKALGIASVNLSLDTLDAQRFRTITRREGLAQTLETYHKLLDHDIPVKVNAVVMEGKNIDDIIPLALLARDHDTEVRFIEEMPFNGASPHQPVLHWNHERIRRHLQEAFPQMAPATSAAGDTAQRYHIPGFRGSLGIIAAFSRTFCGSCNRIRITAQGDLKTCLYDQGVLNLRDLLRTGASDDLLRERLLHAFGHRPANGFEAEGKRQQILYHESMSTIGG